MSIHRGAGRPAGGETGNGRKVRQALHGVEQGSARRGRRDHRSHSRRTWSTAHRRSTGRGEMPARLNHRLGRRAHGLRATRAVPGRTANARARGRPSRVIGSTRTLRDQVLHVGALDEGIGQFGMAAATRDDRRRHGEFAGDLGVESVLRAMDAQDFGLRLADLEGRSPSTSSGLHRMLLAHVEHGIEGTMHRIADRIELDVEAMPQDRPVLAAVGRGLRYPRPRSARSRAGSRVVLDRGLGRGQAGFRQPRRQQAGLRRAADLVAAWSSIRNCRRCRRRATPRRRRLRVAIAASMAAQQRTRAGRGDRPEHRGRVPALAVVLVAVAAGHLGPDLVAADIGGDHRLCRRRRSRPLPPGWSDTRIGARMAGQAGVVVVDRVRGDAVEQRPIGCRAAEMACWRRHARAKPRAAVRVTGSFQPGTMTRQAVGEAERHGLDALGRQSVETRPGDEAPRSPASVPWRRSAPIVPRLPC